MGALAWDVVQNQVLVCVQWGDNPPDEVWDELGDTIMRYRSDEALLPVIVVGDGHGPTPVQRRRAEMRFNAPVRIAFVTRAAATMETAHAMQSSRVHVAIVAPNDYLSALVHLHLPDALVSPVVVTVARLIRELRLERMRAEVWDDEPAAWAAGS